MNIESLSDKVSLEVVKTVLALLLLAVTWGLGQWILAYWDRRKKRRELDIAAAHQFYQLYGEFKAVWRLWKVLKGPDEKDKPEFTPKNPEEARLELLRRATSAEGGIEAITLKLVTERDLCESEIKHLSLFRHSYQMLREQIRYDRKLEWPRDSAEYILVNTLASDVVRMISSNKSFKQPTAEGADENLRAITRLASAEWDEEVEGVRKMIGVQTAHGDNDGIRT